jgi:hypothetical protein
MRAFLLVIIILAVPHFAQAQFDFTKGTFRLKISPGTQVNGLLRLGNNLVVKQTLDGTSVKYPWDEVLAYSLGFRRYVRASGFTIETGFSTREANDDFVQLLDSGAVSLFRYEYAPSGGTVGFGGAPGVGPASRPAIYLLQRAGETAPIEIPYSVMDGSGKRFREALAPFVASRPDLVKVLAAKKITVFSLQTFIHAFNNHEPFLNYPMEGVQSNQ